MTPDEVIARLPDLTVRVLAAFSPEHLLVYESGSGNIAFRSAGLTVIINEPSIRGYIGDYTDAARRRLEGTR